MSKSLIVKPIQIGLAAALLAGVTADLPGGVITDPSVAAGALNIDPPEREDYDNFYGTPKNELLDWGNDLRVLQTFSGFVPGANTVTFTDPRFPDMQFALSGAPSDLAGGEITYPVKYFTSGDSSYHMRAAEPYGSFTLTITFGTWNGSTFTGDRTVEAAALTLVDVYANRHGSVTFRDADGVPLASAALVYNGYDNWDAVGNHLDILFAWDSTYQHTAPISSITITSEESYQPFTSALDDVAFTIAVLPGDANDDGIVDNKDASIVGAHWLATDAAWEHGNFNGDAVIDDKDAAILAAHWGEGGGEESVPEPGSLALLAGIAAMGAVYLRRRTA
jgi:hypothetical protein